MLEGGYLTYVHLAYATVTISTIARGFPGNISSGSPSPFQLTIDDDDDDAAAAAAAAAAISRLGFIDDDDDPISLLLLLTTETFYHFLLHFNCFHGVNIMR